MIFCCQNQLVKRRNKNERNYRSITRAVDRAVRSVWANSARQRTRPARGRRAGRRGIIVQRDVVRFIDHVIGAIVQHVIAIVHLQRIVVAIVRIVQRIVECIVVSVLVFFVEIFSKFVFGIDQDRV